MKVPTTVDTTRAALYALGVLPDEERAAFEERIATSPALQAEVDALRAVTDDLALAADPVAPRDGVRERLLARVAAEASAPPAHPAPPEMLFALAAEAAWIQVAPGLEVRTLSRDAVARSYLVRIAPGHGIPPHEHPRTEHSYILSGSIEVDGTLCHPGDYHRAAAGTRHRGPQSAEGCVLLILETAP